MPRVSGRTGPVSPERGSALRVRIVQRQPDRNAGPGARGGVYLEVATQQLGPLAAGGQPQMPFPEGTLRREARALIRTAF